jgi:hypothetical protein
MSEWVHDPLIYALLYARRGWPVLPVRSLAEDGTCDCGSGHDGDTSKFAKHPRTNRGALDATTDEARIRQWWNWWPKANVGVGTANTDLVVYDIDARHGGDETWAEATEGRELPAHPIAKTGSGGAHHYFRGSPARCGRDAFGPGVDIVSGNRYAIAAPSVTFAGSYGWLVYETEPPPIPGWLLPPPKETAEITMPLVRAGDPRYALGALRGEAERARSRRDGDGRRDHLYTAGLKLSHYVPPLKPEEIVAVLTAAGVESGLGHSEAEMHVRNGLLTGLREGVAS